MNNIDQRLRDASDRFADVATDVTPRSIGQLDRRLVRRNVARDTTKGVAVLALVVAPFVGWQMLTGGTSVGETSSTIPPASPTTGATATSGTPATTVVETIVAAPAAIDLTSPASHDQVRQIIDDALVANGVDTTAGNYEGKNNDPFTGYFNLEVDGSSVEIEVSGWASGSMPEGGPDAGESVSSACAGVETVHGWVFLEDSADGPRQAAVIAPSAGIVAKSSGAGVSLGALQNAVQSIADQIGAATGQPYVASANAGTATPEQACQAPSEFDLAENPDQARADVGIEQILAEVFEVNGLTLDGYGFGRDGDKLMYEGNTVEPEQQSIGINLMAYRISPTEASTPTDGETPAPGTAILDGDGTEFRSARALEGTTIVDVTATSSLDGDTVPDERLSAVAIELAERLDALEW